MVLSFLSFRFWCVLLPFQIALPGGRHAGVHRVRAPRPGDDRLRTLRNDVPRSGRSSKAKRFRFGLQLMRKSIDPQRQAALLSARSQGSPAGRCRAPDRDRGKYRSSSRGPANRVARSRLEKARHGNGDWLVIDQARPNVPKGQCQRVRTARFCTLYKQALPKGQRQRVRTPATNAEWFSPIFVTPKRAKLTPRLVLTTKQETLLSKIEVRPDAAHLSAVGTGQFKPGHGPRLDPE